MKYLLTKRRNTIEKESSNRLMLITFPNAGEHPKEIIRDEIYMLLTVEKVAISEAYQMWTVSHLPPGLGDSSIACLQSIGMMTEGHLALWDKLFLSLLHRVHICIYFSLSCQSYEGNFPGSHLSVTLWMVLTALSQWPTVVPINLLPWKENWNRYLESGLQTGMGVWVIILK